MIETLMSTFSLLEVLGVLEIIEFLSTAFENLSKAVGFLF